MSNNLSKHDEDLLRQIREIDEEWGWARWPDISALASQLENEEKRNMWHRICSHYNHMEEASIGDL